MRIKGGDDLKRKPLVKIVAILLSVIALLLWINYRYLHLSPQNIRDWILSFGWMAPPLYILLYTVRPLVLFPVTLLSLTGGLAFGALWGSIYTIIGATMGALLSFLISRYFGKQLVKKQWTGKWSKLEKKLEEQGFFYVLLIRLIPFISFDLISYAAGLSKIRILPYLLGTVIGIIPITIAFNFLGSSFTKGSMNTVFIAILVIAVVVAIPLIFRKKLDPFRHQEGRDQP
jgi:uncharacterized membrane protein YdjX (TVP38/TMEM64 family)